MVVDIDEWIIVNCYWIVEVIMVGVDEMVGKFVFVWIGNCMY